MSHLLVSQLEVAGNDFIEVGLLDVAAVEDAREGCCHCRVPTLQDAGVAGAAERCLLPRQGSVAGLAPSKDLVDLPKLVDQAAEVLEYSAGFLTLLFTVKGRGGAAKRKIPQWSALPVTASIIAPYQRAHLRMFWPRPELIWIAEVRHVHGKRWPLLRGLSQRGTSKSEWTERGKGLPSPSALSSNTRACVMEGFCWRNSWEASRASCACEEGVEVSGGGGGCGAAQAC